ncbi:hypothetical protein Tco_0273201 [Tanacetum coccineum]
MDWIWRIRVSWSRDHARYLPESSHTISLIRRIGLLWIRRIDLVSFLVFVECRHGYAVSSLMDTTSGTEIKAYSQGLKKVEAQLVAHQQGQLWYEQKIKFMKIDLDDKTDVLTYHKKLLAEAQKEKEELKAKSVFMNKESELEKQPLYDRFVTAEGMHAVPPPMTGNYMPSGPEIKVDYSQFTYGPKQTQPSDSESQTSEFDTCNLTERMARKAELNSGWNKKSSRRELRQTWNNVQRVNKQNQFVPSAVLTRTGKIPVSTARASSTKNDYPHRALKNKGIVDSGCSRRARDKYHNLDDHEMVKSIFNSRKHKDRVGMTILSWMITDEMKLTENYQMTTSTPRTPNPNITEGESSAPQKANVIRLQQKSPKELEAKQKEEKVKEHLMAEEIEKLVEGMENVEENVKVDSSTLRQNDNQNDPGTRLELRSNKESLKVAIIAAKQPVNVIEEEEESVEDDYKLKRREKGKLVEESRSTPSPKTIRSPRIHSTLISSNTEKIQELTVNDPPPSSSTLSSSSPKSKLSATNRLLSLFKPKTGCFKRYKSFFDELQGRYGYLFEHLKTRFMPKKKFNVLAQHLQEIMEESLPKMVDDRVKELTKTQVPVYVAQGLIMERQHNQANVAKMIADAILQECENLWA